MAFKAVPIAASQITGTLTDFPVLVKPSVLTGWTTLTLSEAQSSRWYSDSGKTTELAREVVSADEIHVLVPSAANGTTIYCDYDGVAADYAATDTYGRNAVWADYHVVYHMSSTTDATGGGNDLTATGSPTLTTGAFGGASSAYDYPGNTSHYHKTSGNIIPYTDTNDWSIQAWANPDLSTRGDFLTVYPELMFKWDHSSFADKYVFYSLYATTSVSAASASTYSTDVWRMVHATLAYSSRVGEIFVNGASVGTSTGSGSRIALDAQLAVGVEYAGAAYNPYDGGVDEIRVRQGILTDEWIAAEYKNQGAQATFFGTVTDASGSSASSSPSSSPSVSISSSPSVSVSSSPSVSVSASPSVSISDSISDSISSSPSPSSSVSASPSTSNSPSSSISPSTSVSSSPSVSISSSPSVSVSTSVSSSPSSSLSPSSSVSSSPSSPPIDGQGRYRLRKYNASGSTWEYIS